MDQQGEDRRCWSRHELSCRGRPSAAHQATVCFREEERKPTGSESGRCLSGPSDPHSAAGCGWSEPPKTDYSPPESQEEEEEEGSGNERLMESWTRKRFVERTMSAGVFSYQSVHLLQLPPLLLHTLTLHLDHKQQWLLLRLPECTWAAMSLQATEHKQHLFMFWKSRISGKLSWCLADFSYSWLKPKINAKLKLC